MYVWTWAGPFRWYTLPQDSHTCGGTNGRNVFTTNNYKKSSKILHSPATCLTFTVCCLCSCRLSAAFASPHHHAQTREPGPRQLSSYQGPESRCHPLGIHILRGAGGSQCLQQAPRIRLWLGESACQHLLPHPAPQGYQGLPTGAEVSRPKMCITRPVSVCRNARPPRCSHATHKYSVCLSRALGMPYAH